MHLHGEARRADPRKALPLFELAARAGFVTAQFALGRLHESGQLGQRDLALAHRWYEAAAERGSVEAQVEAGTAYYLGRGAPKSASPHDRDECSDRTHRVDRGRDRQRARAAP